MTTVPLMQGKLLDARIPDYMGLTDPVSKLVQIPRSTPSVIAALIGQKKPEHVAQNLNLAKIPPLTTQQFNQTIKRLSGS
jgi:aryl-alcohol dehydrogenase-like predicted oxidoreductase